MAGAQIIRVQFGDENRGLALVQCLRALRHWRHSGYRTPCSGGGATAAGAGGAAAARAARDDNGSRSGRTAGQLDLRLICRWQYGATGRRRNSPTSLPTLCRQLRVQFARSLGAFVAYLILAGRKLLQRRSKQ